MKEPVYWPWLDRAAVDRQIAAIDFSLLGNDDCDARYLLDGAPFSGNGAQIRCFQRDELGGESVWDSSLCSCNLVPPSGRARMEGWGFDWLERITSDIEWRVVDCIVNAFTRNTPIIAGGRSDSYNDA